MEYVGIILAFWFVYELFLRERLNKLILIIIIFIKLKFYDKKDLKMYILVNKDIEIEKGKLAGQVGHAVCSYVNSKRAMHIMSDYMANGQKKIILKCSQSKLEELEAEGYIAIRDLGLTDLEPNTLTCVNLGIFDEENIPKFVKRLRLL